MTKQVNTTAATAFRNAMKDAKGAKPAAKKTVAAKKPAVKTPAKKAVAAAVLNRLMPVVAKNEDAVMAAAMDGTRRRPVVAINDKGQLVVCCRRTASKNGWALEGTLFKRNRTGKVAVDAKGKMVDAKPAKKPVQRRTTDVDHTLVPKKVVAKLAKTVKEILA